MRKLNLTFRTLILVFTLVSTATTTFAYDFRVNGINYNSNGDEAIVTYLYMHYSGSMAIYESDYSGDVVIPETVTYNGINYTVTGIGDRAFISCPELTSVSIPKTVTYIGDYAFYKCDGLCEITIPDSVVTIGKESFFQCQGLTDVTFGKFLTSVGQYAFYQCSKLKTITCLAALPPTLGNSALPTTKKYVPLEYVEIYQAAGWNVYGFGNDSFSVPDNTAFHGDTIVMPVSMQNENKITAFQTDIYLPSGFELIDDNNEYAVSLSDRKGRDHVIMVNRMPDGALRVLSYSPTLKTFKNNEGELFYINIKVPKGASGTYRIWLRNTILTSVDEDELYALDALSKVYVTNIIMGDVDNSETITVADVVATARYILNYNPEPFVFEAADRNGDGKITITDAVKIAHLVLDQDYNEPTDMNMRAPSMAGDRMNGELNNNTVSINLDNAQDYTALQMDLTLPEGMTASDFALTNRAGGLNLNVKDKGNGKIRVLGYALDLKTIKDHDGAVLTFKVDGTMGEITVDRIELVNTDGESYRQNGFSIMANNPTALDEVTAGKTVASVEYFNLAGQRMASPAAGVTLVVTTYSDGSRVTCKVIR